MDENLKKIKEIILQTAKEMNIEIDRIILFGSRARGDYREDSDYDLLIVTKEKLDKEKEKSFKIKIIRIAAKYLIDIQPILVSSERFEKYKNVYGDIVGMAVLEGIEL
ncbi:MAG: nucleotidyltransferase domain-containing protein [Candidatus Aenigmatarchaeota archaeon]